ncbi:MAG: hypothetical protein E7632_07385 [Ruminococcaceae bacterium]|nr:hypothetical protein [Oscillospiraceae bacterium]
MKKTTILLAGLLALGQLTSCTAAPVEKQTSDPISMVKSSHRQEEWDGEILLAQSEYSGAMLSEDAAAAYPALAESLAQTERMAERAMSDEFDNLLADARGELSLAGVDNFTARYSTLDVQIRRADSVAVSLLSDSTLIYGRINGRYLHGTTYDSKTGKQLAITDVITDMSRIPAIVKEELAGYTWTGDFNSETAVADYFRSTPADGLSWTLDYNGVTFYFASGDLAELGNGRLAATVSFARYPELFYEAYMAVPDAYLVELAQGHPFYTDLDGDGRAEELTVSPVRCDDGLSYDSFGVYTNTDAQYYQTDLPADMGGYHPYYVKMADGGQYLYVFAEGSTFASDDMTLRVIDISGGGFREVGDICAAPGYLPVDLAWALTDPENMMLENFERMEEAKPYRVGEDGMPGRK